MPLSFHKDGQNAHKTHRFLGLSMSAIDKTVLLLERNRPEEMFPPLACNSDNGLFYMDGGYIGSCFISEPMAGADDVTVTRLQTALSLSYPKDTIIQVSLLASRDIEGTLSHYINRRHSDNREGLTEKQRSMLDTMLDRRVGFMMDHRDVPLASNNPTKSNVTQVIVAIKLPCPELPKDEDEMGEHEEVIDKFSESLNASGLNLRQIQQREYLTLLRRILKPYEPLDHSYNEKKLLREQVLDPGDVIDVKVGHLELNDVYVGVLSVKNLPKRTSLLRTAYLAGDPKGIDNQMGMPYMITLTIRYPDQASQKSKIRSKAQTINYQVFGPMAKWVPKLAYKKEGMDIMIDAMEQNDPVLQINLTVTTFAKSRKELSKQTAILRTYYSSMDMDMSPERFIVWPMFWSTLPLFPTSESTKQSFRFHSMGAKHACHFLPIISEWRGTGDGAALMLTSRRGQPTLIDLYDTDTSYNGVVFAESGAGKSFFTQRMIVDYLSIGAKVWVIDVGRSYYKLAKVLDGEFIEFAENSETCLNPFTHVKDIDEEVSFIKSMIAKMAAPNQGLDDYRMAGIEEAIKTVWGSKAQAATISDIADFLHHHPDTRMNDMATMLFPYTRTGTHGMWFDGDNNLNFNNNFVVLELEELKSKRSLQQVVLLQLITRIQQEMFLKAITDNRPQIVIIDESWDLINDTGDVGTQNNGGDTMVANFLEAGYRRCRKANGAFIIVSQSIADIYQSNAGRAIAANSPNKYILQQRSESIEAIRDTKQLDLPDAAFHIMKTVQTHKGKYSEIMIYTPNGWGVTRLIEDRFAQVLFSTKGTERTEVMGDIRNGVDPVKAIENYISTHG